MPQISPQAAEVLDRALALSVEERGMLIDRLVESLDHDPPDDEVEEAWAKEIKRRVDEIRSGKVKTIPGEEMDRWLSERLRDAKK